MCFELKKMLLIYSFLPSFLPSFKGKKEEIKGETSSINYYLRPQCHKRKVFSQYVLWLKKNSRLEVLTLVSKLQSLRQVSQSSKIINSVFSKDWH